MVKVSSKTSDEDRQGKSWLSSGTSTKARQNVIEPKVSTGTSDEVREGKTCMFWKEKGRRKKSSGKECTVRSYGWTQSEQLGLQELRVEQDSTIEI